MHEEYPTRQLPGANKKVQPQPVKPPLNHTDLQGEQTPHSKQTKHKEQDSEET